MRKRVRDDEGIQTKAWWQQLWVTSQCLKDQRHKTQWLCMQRGFEGTLHPMVTWLDAEDVSSIGKGQGDYTGPCGSWHWTPPASPEVLPLSPTSPLHLWQSHVFFFCFTKVHQRTFVLAFSEAGSLLHRQGRLECVTLRLDLQMISHACVSRPSQATFDLNLDSISAVCCLFSQAHFSHLSTDSTWFCFSGKHSLFKNKNKIAFLSPCRNHKMG